MQIAFTICSANYLPYAKALADSVISHNPDFIFCIALADTYTAYDAASFSPHQVIPVTNMEINSLSEMAEKYNIFELSCALKPFVATYLLTFFKDCQSLFYFDADILVYHRLNDAESALQQHSILLTPHLAAALPYNISIRTELDILRAGIYNAGFFAVKNDSSCSQFLHWWKARVKEHCYNNTTEGLFVDQLWLNLVPLYFPQTCIFFHPGYNLAYWNMTERTVTVENGRYYVNEKYPLVFFHYSGYDISRPELVSQHRPTILVSDLPPLEYLFLEFRRRVLENNVSDYFAIPSTLGKSSEVRKKSRYKVLPPVLRKWFGNE